METANMFATLWAQYAWDAQWKTGAGLFDDGLADVKQQWEERHKHQRSVESSGTAVNRSASSP
jgi:hypothetical protein